MFTATLVFEFYSLCQQFFRQVPPIEGGDCTPGNNHTISSEEKKRAFFAEVDRLYAGNDDEKEAAMRTLQDNEIQVMNFFMPVLD